MPLDVEKYLPFFDEFNLTPDQKREMIAALWSVAEAVADMAYGVHPVQLATDAANDNDSLFNSNMIDYFQQAAAIPLLCESADLPPEAAAANDNNHQQEKERKLP